MQQEIDNRRQDEENQKAYEDYIKNKRLGRWSEGEKVMKHEDAKSDKPMVKNAVHKHEKSMHPGKPLTKLAKGGKVCGSSKMAAGGQVCRGGGAATRGIKFQGVK